MTAKDIERLAVVETKMQGVADDVKDIKTEVAAGFAAINARLDGQSADNDKKYAAKWVQTAVGVVIGMVMAAFISYLIFLTFKPTTESTHSTSSSTGTTQTSESGGSGSTSTKETTTDSSTTTTDDPSGDGTAGGVQIDLPKLIN